MPACLPPSSFTHLSDFPALSIIFFNSSALVYLFFCLWKKHREHFFKMSWEISNKWQNLDWLIDGDENISEPLVFWTHSTRPHSSFNGTTACKYEHQMKIITSRPFLVWFSKEARWTTVSILDGSELYRYWPTIVATTLRHCTRNGEISRLRVEHRRVEIIGIICSIPFPAPPPPASLPPPVITPWPNVPNYRGCVQLRWPLERQQGKFTPPTPTSHCSFGPFPLLWHFEQIQFFDSQWLTYVRMWSCLCRDSGSFIKHYDRDKRHLSVKWVKTRC